MNPSDRPRSAQPTVACIAGRRIVEVLADMRVRTVLLDEDLPWESTLLVDVPIETDLDDWDTAEALLRTQHERVPLRAVFSVRDSYLPLASYLAERLEVRGLPLAAALNCHDKARMRQALHGAGIPGPVFALVGEPDEAALACDSIGYPVVMKRASGAGGAGVRLCHNGEEAKAAAHDLLDSAPGVDLLAEAFLDGPEFAVQTVTIDGRTEVLSILSEHVGPPPRFAETGYDYPSGLAADAEAELADYVTRALAALGFDNGIAHVQVRRTAEGPRLVEVNPRPPGGLLGLVSEAVSGVSLLRAAVSAALGEPLTREHPTATHVRYRCVVFDRAGIVDFDPAALREEPDQDGAVVTLDVDPGDPVLPVDHPDGGVYGRIVVLANDPETLDRQFARIEKDLAISVVPAPDPESR